jgi:ribosome-associated protein
MSAVPDTGRNGLSAEALARRIAGVADAKQADDVVALDMRSLVSYTDFLVICTARNERLAKAIHEEVHQRLKHECGLLPATVEGEQQARWVLMDYLDCVFHVFVPELRERYRLDVLWGEAPRLELGAGTGAGGRTAASG